MLSHCSTFTFLLAAARLKLILVGCTLKKLIGSPCVAWRDFTPHLDDERFGGGG
jgi:hypothetical protein